jgi:hypothetical protein
MPETGPIWCSHDATVAVDLLDRVDRRNSSDPPQPASGQVDAPADNISGDERAGGIVDDSHIEGVRQHLKARPYRVSTGLATRDHPDSLIGLDQPSGGGLGVGSRKRHDHFPNPRVVEEGTQRSHQDRLTGKFEKRFGQPAHTLPGPRGRYHYADGDTPLL